MPYKLKTVIYLDDDANLLFLLKAAIEKYLPETTVRTFENLASLQAFLENHRADLIITDYLMPGHTLVELLDSTADTYLPVIVMSGLTADEIKWPNSDRVIGYIQKPFGRFITAQYIEDIWRKNQIRKASG